MFQSAIFQLLDILVPVYDLEACEALLAHGCHVQDVLVHDLCESSIPGPSLLVNYSILAS